jgi:hypothetical protein
VRPLSPPPRSVPAPRSDPAPAPTRKVRRELALVRTVLILVGVGLAVLLTAAVRPDLAPPLTHGIKLALSVLVPAR